jgi:hypothetical protein
MKITGHVIAVEDKGDELRLRMQGTAPTDAKWRDMRVVEFTVAHTKKNARALYMGRRLTITIEPT